MEKQRPEGRRQTERAGEMPAIKVTPAVSFSSFPLSFVVYKQATSTVRVVFSQKHLMLVYGTNWITLTNTSSISMRDPALPRCLHACMHAQIKGSSIAAACSGRWAEALTALIMRGAFGVNSNHMKRHRLHMHNIQFIQLLIYRAINISCSKLK